MKARRKLELYCIGCPAGKPGLCLPVRNQAGIGRYAAGTNPSAGHPSGSQNQEKYNIDPLNSPSPRNKQNQSEEYGHLRSVIKL